MKLLPEHEDTNPDEPDAYNQTALTEATQRGHKGVVKLLQWEGY